MEIKRKPITGIPRKPIMVNRTPIMVGRIPITGVRVPIMEGGYQELDWDTIYAGLVNYIKFAAKQVSEQFSTNCVNSAEDLFQEGQLLLYHCYTLYKHKPINEFNALFKASLWRKLRGIGAKKEFIQVDITDAYDLGYSDNVVNDMYEEYKLQQVVEILEGNDIAITILKEMINPSNRTLWECEMDVARKQMLQNQNYQVAVPQSMTIKGIHIQRALEISKAQYKQELDEIRKVFNRVYTKEEAYVEGVQFLDADEEEGDEAMGEISIAYCG